MSNHGIQRIVSDIYWWLVTKKLVFCTRTCSVPFVSFLFFFFFHVLYLNVVLKTHVQKKIAAYCTELVNYIHIRYTYIKLHKYILLSLLSLTTVQALMCLIHYFFENSDYKKHMSLQVTRLLNNYHIIISWKECLSKKYIHLLDVLVTIVACGMSISTKNAHDAVHRIIKLIFKEMVQLHPFPWTQVHHIVRPVEKKPTQWIH